MAIPSSFVWKITKSKHQMTNKLQISNRLKKIGFLFGILNFGYCYLFVFWDLLFGIMIMQ